jgi:two-component system, LuxR family, response regulator FixJ
MIIHSNVAKAKPTVLIVDDDPAVRSSLQFCLEIEGFQVRTYGCGTDLLFDPDIPESGCLVVDYHLPDMNGLELLSELRCRGLDIPVILVTTNPTALVRARTTRAGAILIEKPLLNDALFEEIRAATRPMASRPATDR